MKLLPPDKLPEKYHPLYYKLVIQLMGKKVFHDDNADIANWILTKIIYG